MKKVAQQQDHIMGFMRADTLTNYCRELINRKQVGKLTTVVKYCEDVGQVDVLDSCRQIAQSLEDSDVREVVLQRLRDHKSTDDDEVRNE